MNLNAAFENRVYGSYEGQPSSISYRIASNSDSWKFVNLSSRMFIRENKVIMQKNITLWL